MKTRLTLLACLLLSACTWVDLREGAESVQVMDAAPDGCKRIGQTNAVTQSEIVSIDRNRGKVARELETLARNAAVGMSGDTIVPETEISEAGEQRFGIYSCATND